MITGTSIHEWLQAPNLVSASDIASLEQVREEYPYFSPSALLMHFFERGNVRHIPLEEQYGYNPVVYYYWKDNEVWEQSEKQSSRLKSWEDLNEHFLEHEKDHFDKDYFENVSEEIPNFETAEQEQEPEDKSLMVVMSFAEWLQFLQRKTKHEQDEENEKRALRTQWQKQKMAEAMEEENDEIPENVFEMAVNSISRDEGIVSESMALVYAKQGKLKEAIDIYKKLSLNNPEKSIYFADKINNLQLDL